ncbi:MAG: sigma 54-interacting transcriptional regulator [Aquincola sp.]|nr:sigma 54-interacting transcriptional regulator [Aquincola sp.]
MVSSPDPALVHARALRGRGSTLPPGFRPADEILESWARCLDHGLDYAARLRLPVVDTAELVRRRDQAGALRRLAQAELETLMQQIAGSNFLLAFADADGTVLDVLADNRFAMSSDEDIAIGSCWREEVAGTNGLGTALRTGRCIAVTGPDHYFLRLAAVSCTASPIRDADGQIVGLLDASSYVESRQRHTQALVQMSTTHIENVLLAEQRPGQLLVAIHPRREFLRTISAGLLTFDGEGVLTALNARAQLLLAGLDAQRGRHFEQLFGERFAGFLARLHVQGEVRLTDRFGSAMVARWVGPRTAAAHAASSHPDAAPKAAAATASVPAAGFVAEDGAVAEALRAAQQALRGAVPLLVRGETGSGKECLVREALATVGLGGRLVVLRCAALTVDRLVDQLGANPGVPFVLLLDEVGELAPAAQAALLAWLDERMESPRASRVIATTQHDLGATVSTRDFRADLLYRLQGVAVYMPPLRDRSDFEACARHALARVAPQAHLDARAVELLRRQPWPGNWRELQSVLTRAWYALGAPAGDTSVPIDAARLEALLGPAPAAQTHASVLQQETTTRVLREWERQGGSISATARRLGISRNTVYRHLREAERLPPSKVGDALR